MTDMLTVIEPDGATKKGFDAGLSDDELLHCYRTMLLVRSFDEICLKLQRAGRIGFSIPNRGIEATQVGAASALRKSDWIFPSYRDFGMALFHDVPAVEMMHNMFGNAEDSAKGRQMPVHFSFVEPIHFYSISSPIGTHLPHAVGAAYASKMRGEDTVHLVSFGDGGTSSLGFLSGLNFDGVWKSPVVFLCQNNGYAISCPSDEQTASDGYASKASAYGMPGVTVDGNDLFAVRDAIATAAARARHAGVTIQGFDVSQMSRIDQGRWKLTSATGSTLYAEHVHCTTSTNLRRAGDGHFQAVPQTFAQRFCVVAEVQNNDIHISQSYVAFWKNPAVARISRIDMPGTYTFQRFLIEFHNPDSAADSDLSDVIRKHLENAKIIAAGGSFEIVGHVNCQFTTNVDQLPSGKIDNNLRGYYSMGNLAAGLAAWRKAPRLPALLAGSCVERKDG